MNEFDAGDGGGRMIAALEPQHGPHSLFYTAVVLFNAVVSIFAHPPLQFAPVPSSSPLYHHPNLDSVSRLATLSSVLSRSRSDTIPQRHPYPAVLA